MTTVPAKKIDEPAEGSRVVFDMDPSMTGALFRGSGKTNYSCGVCRFVLVKNISHGQIKNVVIKCPKCRAYNEIP